MNRSDMGGQFGNTTAGQAIGGGVVAGIAIAILAIVVGNALHEAEIKILLKRGSVESRHRRADETALAIVGMGRHNFEHSDIQGDLAKATLPWNEAEIGDNF